MFHRIILDTPLLAAIVTLATEKLRWHQPAPQVIRAVLVDFTEQGTIENLKS